MTENSRTITQERDVTIVNRLGLHARAAARLVTLASEYDSEVRLSRNGKEVSGKSIMGVMMLAAAKGSSIRLIAEGEDAEQAINALAELVERKFDESD